MATKAAISQNNGVPESVCSGRRCKCVDMYFVRTQDCQLGCSEGFPQLLCLRLFSVGSWKVRRRQETIATDTCTVPGTVLEYLLLGYGLTCPSDQQVMTGFELVTRM